MMCHVKNSWYKEICHKTINCFESLKEQKLEIQYKAAILMVNILTVFLHHKIIMVIFTRSLDWSNNSNLDKSTGSS